MSAKKAFDQIIGCNDTGKKENKNGWSIKSSNPLPQWVEFTLRDVSKVNSVALKSLWPGEKDRPKGFKIELFKEESWIKPEEVRIEHSAVKGEFSCNQINMLEK